jgi:cell shape-determining protein MreD
MLIFFVIFHEDSRFALIFAFFSGLLIDLYYPAALGLHALIYTGLSQSLLYIKKYITSGILVTLLAFSIFYIIQYCLSYIVIGSPFNAGEIGFTILIFSPVFLALKWVFFGIWQKS